ncbi:hypothetical protein Nepgr_013524 [Nepenthes gracilis]|uniref:Uncharacterized protein n=1 Tax=Nepenthes gracilis TaxID=150966 RepID=A0AAD3XP34_NEPGR|nr:hypothetical protein Nepgr_013524 [Nepenthes gracilis]
MCSWRLLMGTPWSALMFAVLEFSLLLLAAWKRGVKTLFAAISGCEAFGCRSGVRPGALSFAFCLLRHFGVEGWMPCFTPAVCDSESGAVYFALNCCYLAEPVPPLDLRVSDAAGATAMWALSLVRLLLWFSLEELVGFLLHLDIDCGVADVQPSTELMLKRLLLFLDSGCCTLA